jgi:superfamily I DNA/RNA helicase
MEKKEDSLDYVFVLSALNEIPFGVGKNLLVDFLVGEEKNSSVIKNDLDLLKTFGSLSCYSREEIEAMINNLIVNKLILVSGTLENKFCKILKLSFDGHREMSNPILNDKKLKNNFEHKETTISLEEKELFNQLNDFLGNYNDEQKKAIVSNEKEILCIAGAGSGKTSVLTKRIEFLVKYKGVDASKILAITFTRKAREEMLERLTNLGIDVSVETFNSFCEKILKKYSREIYGSSKRVCSYVDRMLALNFALDNMGLDFEKVIDRYFSDIQKREKSFEELSRLFMGDCFSVLDYFKRKNIPIETLKNSSVEIDNAKMIAGIVENLKNYMDTQRLRDYTDQVLDALEFFRKNKDKIPLFEHVLIDEYQDVNGTQIELIDLLGPENLFCVGDPRQSIFGWRGSDINYILKFRDKYPNAEVINLVKNYRSSKQIVEFMNHSVNDMGLIDLSNSRENQGELKLCSFESEEKEREFVVSKILSSSIAREEIFVLARTNKQLRDLSFLMNKKGIRHILKTDEGNTALAAKSGEVTLATVHSIKGLEAELVFVIGCTNFNFPCNTSDHPIIELVKIKEYDKEEEEKRLFYVAISRAKNILYLTYSGKRHTYFINEEMKNLLSVVEY